MLEGCRARVLLRFQEKGLQMIGKGIMREEIYFKGPKGAIILTRQGMSVLCLLVAGSSHKEWRLFRLFLFQLLFQLKEILDKSTLKSNSVQRELI